MHLIVAVTVLEAFKILIHLTLFIIARGDKYQHYPYFTVGETDT